MADPASLRYNNPGAMYPGPSSRTYGSTATHTIGGGHLIAEFPEFESGGAAMFDLMRRKYSGMPLESAIAKWSGNNSSSDYARSVARKSGVEPGTVIDQGFLSDPARSVPFARAMADWEAGRSHPATDEQWAAAHARAFGGTAQQPYNPTMDAQDGPGITARAVPQPSSVPQQSSSSAVPDQPRNMFAGTGGPQTKPDEEKPGFQGFDTPEMRALLADQPRPTSLPRLSISVGRNLFGGNRG